MLIPSGLQYIVVGIASRVTEVYLTGSDLELTEQRARDLEQENSLLLGNTDDISQSIRWNQRKSWLALVIVYHI